MTSTLFSASTGTVSVIAAPSLARVAEGPHQQVVADVGVELAEAHRLDQQEADDERAVDRVRQVRQRLDTDLRAGEPRRAGDQLVDLPRHEQDEAGAEPA